MYNKKTKNNLLNFLGECVMKKIIYFSVLFLFYSLNYFAQSKTSFVEGEIIIEVESPFKEKHKKDGIMKTDKEWFNQYSEKYRCVELEPIFKNAKDGIQKYYRVKFTEKDKIDQFVKKINQENGLIKAWKNRKMEFHSSNDPLFSQQWALSKIQAEQAWNIHSGDPSVILAILDSGIDLGDPNSGNPLDPHPDLVNNLWNINLQYGINFVNANIPPYDYVFHGTHVAGIAGAVTNNNIGIAGIAGGGYTGNGTKILVVKVGDIGTDQANLSAGVEGAVDAGAKVINISIGYTYGLDDQDESATIYEPPAWFEAAFDYAEANDVLVVASIGNNSADLSGEASIYPAQFDNVFSVASTDVYDAKANNSNYASWCDISAPGVGILSTYPRYLDGAPPTGYTYLSGTSMSAPYVSGVAALIRAYAPAADLQMVRAILKGTTDNIVAQNLLNYKFKLGTGRLNAYKALFLINSPPTTPQNFQVSFLLNQNPTLTWSANNEADLKGYRIFKKYTSQGYTHTVSVFTTNTTYSDNDFISNYIIGEDIVEYWVVAKDIIDNVSNETQHISGDGTSYNQQKIAIEETTDNSIKTYMLFENYPNPFNPSTILSYQIPKNGLVSLIVYNSLGQVVSKLVNKHQTSGKYSVKFNAENLPSGLYFVKLESGDFISTKKMMLIK